MAIGESCGMETAAAGRFKSLLALIRKESGGKNVVVQDFFRRLAGGESGNGGAAIG